MAPPPLPSPALRAHQTAGLEVLGPAVEGTREEEAGRGGFLGLRMERVGVSVPWVLGPEVPGIPDFAVSEQSGWRPGPLPGFWGSRGS